MSTNGRIGLIVPTLNAGPLWREFADAVRSQVLRPDRMLVVDSASTDDTPDQAVADGFEVLRIDRKDFDHGGTRRMAAAMLTDCDFLIFLTQDAILGDPHSITHLLAPFADPSVAGVCGRQLPRPGAGEIEIFARHFNYPATSSVRSYADAGTLGVKAAFFSNSYAAYRRAALDGVGGFPSNLIVGEDMYTAGKLLLAGWNLVYTADATVFHSHSYTMIEEARRYFDIGVLMALQPWLPERFGTIKGHGLKYVRAEAAFLWQRRPTLIFPALARNFLKLLTFQCGKRHQLLPKVWARKLSMHRNFWITYRKSQTS
jgi:rhamnosyltransferase